MMKLEIRLESGSRSDMVEQLCVIEDKTAVVIVVASYHSVSRNPVRFKALICTQVRTPSQRESDPKEPNCSDFV